MNKFEPAGNCFSPFLQGNKIVIFFLTKKMRKRFYGHPTGHNFGHTLDMKHIFLKG